MDQNLENRIRERAYEALCRIPRHFGENAWRA
jgi:hypothetical protein